MAKLVGATVDEVNVLNFLSVNLHLLMVNCNPLCLAIRFFVIIISILLDFILSTNWQKV